MAPSLYIFGVSMVNKSLFSTGTDTWETPQWLFDELNEEFGFTVDVCAEDSTAKLPLYFTKEDDSLSMPWDRDWRVWCNPPYSSRLQDRFVRKCYEHWRNGGFSCMLIPARTDTARFQTYILNNAEIRFIPGRLRFGGSDNPAPFPSMLVIFHPRRYSVHATRYAKKTRRIVGKIHPVS